MLVYNAEIWPEYKVAHTKSDWSGFKITSDITVPIVWQYWLQLAPNSLLWGCIKIYLNLAKQDKFKAENHIVR